MLSNCNEYIKFTPWKIVAFLWMCLPCVMYSQDAWPVFSLGSPPLYLNLPGVPEPMETQIQPSMLEVMKAYYAFRYDDDMKGIKVMLLQTSYAQHIHPDFTIISDQTIRELSTRGALDIIYETTSIEIEGKKGIRQRGTLVIKGETMDFTTTILNEETHVWKVIIFERMGDAEANQAGQFILESITFKEN